MFAGVQTVAISYSDKKNKKRNFFTRKLRTAKSKERSKSENALDIDQCEYGAIFGTDCIKVGWGDFWHPLCVKKKTIYGTDCMKSEGDTVDDSRRQRVPSCRCSTAERLFADVSASERHIKK